jgi:hypothetical protein
MLEGFLSHITFGIIFHHPQKKQTTINSELPALRKNLQKNYRKKLTETFLDDMKRT